MATLVGTPATTAQTRRTTHQYPRREIVNAILYILYNGAAWRMLPYNLLPYRIVFHYCRTWRQDCTW